MGLCLSHIFHVLLLFTVILSLVLATDYNYNYETQRFDFPYPNYISPPYPYPPFNATCVCNDPYEVFIQGPFYGDGCEIKVFGRPKCAQQVPFLNGCFCDTRNGWYRHPMTLKCVKAGDCPKKFNYWNCGGKNEEYRIGDDTCKDSCDFHTGKVKCVAEQCVPGCYCKKGFARSKKHNQQCVPLNDCEVTDFNEIYG